MASKPGPAPTHESNAARQKAYRDRKADQMTQVSESVETLVEALCASGCARLTRGLDPKDPGASIKKLAERIADGRLIYAKKETPEARKRRSDKAREIAKAKRAASKQ